MSQKFPSRLAYLMHTFGITNKELAEILHIDYSLVSKWRNSKRMLSPRSKYLDQIASFFLKIDARNDFKTIKKLLPEEQFADWRSKNINVYETLLKKWIVSDNENIQENLLKTLQKQGSYTAQVEVFKGNEGRRLVSRKFADLALSLPPGQELLLYSESSQASWITEDSTYRGTWKTNYLEVLKKGSSIHLVHSIDRELDSLIGVLLEWLPLDLTGNVTSYYYPHFSEQALEPTLNVIKDQAAFFSLFRKGQDTFYTLFFTDPVTVRQAETILRELIAQCRSIYSKFGLRQISQLLQELAVAGSKRENSYYYANLPYFSLLSAKLPADKAKSESYRKTLHGLPVLLTQGPKNNYCRLILDRNMLASLAQPPDAPARAAGGPAVRDMLAHYLRELAALLEKQDNVEIALTEKAPTSNGEEVSMYIKENTIAMISTLLPDKSNPLTLIAHEPSIVQAYYLHYENFWTQLTAEEKDKRHNLQYLQNMAKSLKSS